MQDVLCRPPDLQRYALGLESCMEGADGPVAPLHRTRLDPSGARLEGFPRRLDAAHHGTLPASPPEALLPRLAALRTALLGSVASIGVAMPWYCWDGGDDPTVYSTRGIEGDSLGRYSLVLSLAGVIAALVCSVLGSRSRRSLKTWAAVRLGSTRPGVAPDVHRLDRPRNPRLARRGRGNHDGLVWDRPVCHADVGARWDGLRRAVARGHGQVGQRGALGPRPSDGLAAESPSKLRTYTVGGGGRWGRTCDASSGSARCSPRPSSSRRADREAEGAAAVAIVGPATTPTSRPWRSRPGRSPLRSRPRPWTTPRTWPSRARRSS